MKVKYSYYEPNKGFEEIQAQIYKSATTRYGTQIAITAEQIQQRYETENTDPKGVRYALKENGNPLAYIQTRVTEADENTERRTWIGYPWIVEGCPTEVQEKLFNEMFEYVKQRDPDNEIVMGYFPDCWKECVFFAKSKGYEVIDKGFQYIIDVQKASRVDLLSYSARIATLDDLDALVELSKADPSLKSAFLNEEARVSYFKDHVLPDGHTILLSKDNQLICAGAPLKGLREDGIVVRFSTTRSGFEDATKALLIEISKHLVEIGWLDDPLINESRRSRLNHEDQISMIKELGGKIQGTFSLFGLKT
jgi:hypothetical protein